MPDVWYPGAIRKPITANKGRKPLTVYNRLNLHVAVSEGSSLFGYFNKTGIPDSHLYLRRDGTFEQYVPFDMRAFADLEGNDATISVETQGMAGGGWTPEQRESIARLYAWLVINYGLARKMATSSAPGEPSRGLSWHRLGVPHRGTYSSNGLVVKQLTSVQPGYLQSRSHIWYSGVAAKACPGDDRIPQVRGIFDRAMAILDGETLTPTSTGGFMSNLTEAQQKDVWEKVGKIFTITDETRTKVKRLEEDEETRRLAQLEHNRASAKRQLELIELVSKLATTNGADPTLIEGIVRDAFEKITLTFDTGA